MTPTTKLLPLLLAIALTGCNRNAEPDIRHATAPKEDAPPTQSPVADATPPTPTLPAGHPAISPDDATKLGANAPSAGWTYTTPDGWQLQPDKPMRLATFIATAGDHKAEVVVSRFPQGSGSFVANANRWRNQVGLPPVESADPLAAPEISLGPDKGRLYDFVGPTTANPRLRQIVAIVNKSGMDWFFKIIGPADLVESQRPAFDKFLASVRLSD